MLREKKVSRATLVKYAGLLGRDSLAARTLVQYDHFKARGDTITILMRNNGFALRFGLNRDGIRRCDRLA